MIRMVLITSIARWTWRSFFRSSIGSRDGCRSFCASLGSSTTMSGVMPLPWIERPFGVKYFTPHGRSIHGKGITPDIVVELRSEEHTSELHSLTNLVCRLLLEK